MLTPFWAFGGNGPVASPPLLRPPLRRFSLCGVNEKRKIVTMHVLFLVNDVDEPWHTWTYNGIERCRHIDG